MRDWDTACPDWEQRIVTGRTLTPVGALFPDEATEALEVFKSLRVVDVAGSPTFAEAGSDWIFDLVAAIFGAYDPDAGRRLIREFFLCVSKKNGKSTLAAGIMLTALIRNWRNSNELIILAPTIEAAQNSFKPAADMVRADPELSADAGGFLHIQDHLRQITHLKTKATLKVLAADSATVVGKKAAFVLVDELWEFGSKPRADAMLLEAAGGLVARPEGFVVYISTMADAPPAGVWKDRLGYARKVRDGEVQDKRFLPIIYEFPKRMVETEGYLDPENFYITNPNIGRSVQREWLEEEIVKQRGKDAGARNVFLAKHLNVEIGQSLASDAWAGAMFWPKQSTEGLTLARVIAECEVMTGGVDGGGLDDLLSLSFIGRHAVTRQWMHWQHSWAHEGVLERRKGEATRLRGFERDGNLTIVKDMPVAFAALAGKVAEVFASGKLAHVGMDPFGVGLIIDAFAELGVPTELPFLSAVSQGYQLQGAIKTAEVKLASGEFVHGGQPIMAWAVGNAKVEPKGNAITITKQAAGSAKIDPLMSCFDAVALMSKNPVAMVSIYDRPDAWEGQPEPDQPPQSDVIDLSILADPSHPQWQRMREMYEARMFGRDEIEEAW